MCICGPEHQRAITFRRRRQPVSVHTPTQQTARNQHHSPHECGMREQRVHVDFPPVVPEQPWLEPSSPSPPRAHNVILGRTLRSAPPLRHPAQPICWLAETGPTSPAQAVPTGDARPRRPDRLYRNRIAGNRTGRRDDASRRPPGTSPPGMVATLRRTAVDRPRARAGNPPYPRQTHNWRPPRCVTDAIFVRAKSDKGRPEERTELSACPGAGTRIRTGDLLITNHFLTSRWNACPQP